MDIPNINFDNLVKTIEQTEHEKLGYASILFKQLMKEIKAFNSTLDDEHETAIYLTSAGGSFNFVVTHVKFKDPYLIVFYGILDDGSEIELIQNVSQLNFVLMKKKRPDPQVPKRQIGFSIS